MSTSLSNLISIHATELAANGDWQAVADVLNALTQIVTDETHWTLGLIQAHPQLGIDVARGIAGAVKKAAESDPLMEGVLLALSTTGIQLHTPERQTIIDQIGAGLPAEAIAGIKSLGIRTVPVVETTAEECQAAMLAEQARLALQTLQDRRRAWDQLSAQIRSQIESGQLPDNAAVVAAVTDGLGV